MKLQTKILLTFIPLALVSGVGMTFLSKKVIHAILVEEVAARGIVKAKDIKSAAISGLQKEDENLLLAALHLSLEDEKVISAAALDIKGRVLAHTNVMEKNKIYNDYATRKALQSYIPTHVELKNKKEPVLEILFPVRVDPLSKTGEELILYAKMAGSSQQLLGMLRLGLSLKGTIETEKQIAGQVFWVMTGIGLLVLLLTLLLLRKILQPVGYLAEATKEISKGIHGIRVPIHSTDELGDLSRSFNAMSLELSQTTVSKDFLDGILKNMLDALIVATPEGSIRLINDTALKMVGYNEKELKGKAVAMLFEEAVDVFDKSLFCGKTLENTETYLLDKSGNKVPVLMGASASINKHGQPDGYIIAAKDITERKRNEEALVRARTDLELRVQERTAKLMQLNAQLNQEIAERAGITKSLRDSEERLRSVFINAPIILSAFDQAGVLTFLGGKGLEAVHLDPEKCIGRSTMEIFRDSPRIIDSIRRALSTGDTFVSNASIAGRAFETWYSPIKEENSEVKEVISVFLDISERKNLEEQLHHSQKMDAIGQLSSGIAHDFNNLLTVITGYVKIVLADTKDKDTLSALEQVDLATQKASSLTRQLLSFSRKQIVQPRVLNLNTLIMDVGKMLRCLIGENINLVSIPDPSIGLVNVDPGQMEQVLVNLVVNARDAMPKGGNVTIQTENKLFETPPVLGDKKLGPGRYVRIIVKDTGAGIDEETQKRIFEPFFTTKEKGKGTGLGLYTVYSIVKQNSGHISVESAIGQGTSFTIILPVTHLSLPSESHGDEAAKSMKGNEAILLVENDPLVMELALRILKSSGYHVLEADHPAKALALCRKRKKPIHLLMTDIVMPDMNGREVAEQINELFPDIKILFISGYTDDKVIHQGVKDKDFHFLEKPFTPDALKRKLRNILDQ